MKQLGLALHNYHDTYKIFPPAHIPWNRPTGQNAMPRNGESVWQNYGPSWMVLVLPFMEQSPLHDKANFNVAMSTDINAPVRSAWIPSYVCPSDPFAKPENALTRYTNINSPAGYWGRCSYGISGSYRFETSFRWEWRVENAFEKGLAGQYQAARFADITDGTSNTIAVGEFRVGPRVDDPRGTWALGRGSMQSGCAWGDCWGINYQAGNPDDMRDCVGNGSDWRRIKMHCWSGGDGQHGIKSVHPGGAQVTLGDASVRFVSETMDRNTYRAVKTIQGAEQVSFPD